MTQRPPPLFNVPVIFDFDGVIADSEAIWFACCRQTYATLGHSIIESEYYRHWAGGGAGPEGENARHSLGMTLAECDQINIDRKKLYAQCVADGGISLYEDAVTMIQAADRRGLCAIASNSPADHILSILKHAGVTLTATPVIGHSDTFAAKPAPDTFIHAAHILGVDCSSVVVVEDTQKGITAARAANMRVLLIRNQTNAHLSDSVADAVVTRSWVTEQLA